ncbi:MAG TPA: STAS domain-containing protein [Actinospica sp.]|nr:STAS domain-containing protein [Actinospica sp.]
MGAHSGFTVAVEAVEAGERGRVVVAVSGDLDLWGATKLHLPLTDALKSPVVVLDLTDCGFCDSSGLRTLLHAVARAREEGTSLRIAGVGTSVLRVLEMTGLLSELSLYQDVPAALKG